MIIGGGNDTRHYAFSQTLNHFSAVKIQKQTLLENTSIGNYYILNLKFSLTHQQLEGLPPAKEGDPKKKHSPSFIKLLFYQKSADITI